MGAYPIGPGRWTVRGADLVLMQPMYDPDTAQQTEVPVDSQPANPDQHSQPEGAGSAAADQYPGITDPSAIQFSHSGANPYGAYASPSVFGPSGAPGGLAGLGSLGATVRDSLGYASDPQPNPTEMFGAGIAGRSAA